MTTVADYIKNKKWENRIREAFVILDRNNNKKISRKDYTKFNDLLEKNCPNREKQMAKLRTITSQYCDMFGIIEGMEIDVTTFIQMCATVCLAEARRYQQHQETWIEKLLGAVFDVIDEDNSKSLTFEEYLVVMKSSNLGEVEAKAAFQLLDTDRSGTLDKKEFTQADVKFWCTLDSPEMDGLFGPKFK